MWTLPSARFYDGPCCEFLVVVINVSVVQRNPKHCVTYNSTFLSGWVTHSFSFYFFSAQVWPVLAWTWYKELRSGSSDLERNSQHVALHREKVGHDSQNGKLSCFDNSSLSSLLWTLRLPVAGLFSLGPTSIYRQSPRMQKGLDKQGLRRAVSISRPKPFLV